MAKKRKKILFIYPLLYLKINDKEADHLSTVIYPFQLCYRRKIKTQEDKKSFILVFL